MNSYKELNENELYHSYQPSDFNFTSTEEIKGTNEVLGQEEIVAALLKGLKIEDRGYNLYVCTEYSKRIDEVIMSTIKKVANTKKACKALGYLYNFHCPNEPVAIELNKEMALAFKDDLEELKAVIVNDLPIVLEGIDVKKKQKAIIQEFEHLKLSYWIEISEIARKKNIELKAAEDGIQLIPLDEEGKVLDAESVQELTEEEQEIINVKIEEIQRLSSEMMEMLQKNEDDYYELYQEVKHEAVLKELSVLIGKLKVKYAEYPKIQVYLNGLAEDLLKHIELFAISDSEEKAAKKDMKPWMMNHEKSKCVRKYGFNLLTVPAKKGVPIINDFDKLSTTLCGEITGEVEDNTIYRDFSHIRPGLFHLANHGYLIVHMQNLIEMNKGWQQLKSMLRSEKIVVECNEGINMGFGDLLKPESVEADLKVIIIGSEPIYNLLSQEDSEFRRYFKVKINLEEEIVSKPQQIKELAKVIKKNSRKEKIPTVTTGALLEMIDYSSRKLGSIHHFHGDIEFFMNLLKEARVYDKKCIDERCMEQVIASREEEVKKLREQYETAILEDTYLIDTQGSKVGQVNGLAVYTVGENLFGRPLKITATTYKGRRGIVDIEGLAQLSGSIHTKGVRILEGFLGAYFAQDFPLSLNGNICFEQNYAVVDGDSASSAELYALISSLSEIPIKQNLAVTGSMNQLGEIQPIGGVNEKIEGFFSVCNRRGLKGNEGVIIPKQNTKDLLLSKQVRDKVKLSKFHIYEIETVWEGMSLLMDCSKEELIRRTYNKLKKYNQ